MAEKPNSTTSTTVYLPITTAGPEEDMIYISDTGMQASVNNDADLQTSGTLNKATSAQNMDGVSNRLSPPVITSGTSSALGKIEWSQNSDTANDPNGGNYWTIGMLNEST